MRLPIARGTPTVLLLLLAALTWAGSKPADSTSTFIRPADVADAVRAYVGEEAKTRDGLCRISDPVENATLDLRLKSVRDDKLLRVDATTFVTCATLETADGTAYDVDFYVKGTNRNTLKVIDATIHSKNGVQRYAWSNDKGLVRVMALSSEMPQRDEAAH